jgi:hypothetical protein
VISECEFDSDPAEIFDYVGGLDKILIVWYEANTAINDSTLNVFRAGLKVKFFKISEGSGWGLAKIW